MSAFAGSVALKVAVNRHDLSVIGVYDPRERALPDVGLVHVKDSESGQDAWVNTSSRKMRQTYSEWFSKVTDNASKLFLRYKVDSVSISKRLGHAQVSTTANIYAHVMEAADKKNADVFLKKA